MADDKNDVALITKFFYLAKYEGDRGPRSEPTGDDSLDRLTALQEDLSDPACFEIVCGGDGIKTCIWSKKCL